MSTINLLPEDYLRQRQQHRANVLCIILFGAVMAGVGGAVLVSQRSARNIQQVFDRVNASYADAAKSLTEMQQLEMTKRQMIAKAKATASLLERVPRSYLLAVINQALPENAALVRVSLQPSRKTSRKDQPKGSKFDAIKNQAEVQPSQPAMCLEVTGVAATDMQVAAIIANLLTNPLLTSVDLDYSQDKALDVKKTGLKDLHVREFKITMEIKPNVDVIDLVKSSQGKTTADSKGRPAVQGAKS